MRESLRRWANEVRADAIEELIEHLEAIGMFLCCHNSAGVEGVAESKNARVLQAERRGK
jgi:hypothetical protein